MIAHLPFTGRWKELVLSEWFSQLESDSSKIKLKIELDKDHRSILFQGPRFRRGGASDSD